MNSRKTYEKERNMTQNEMHRMHVTKIVPYWFVLLLLQLVSLPLRESFASDLDSGRDEFGDDIRPIGM